MELKPIRQFIDALGEAVSSVGRKVCYIASADLAHMAFNSGILKASVSMTRGHLSRKTMRCWSTRRRWTARDSFHRSRGRRIGGKSAVFRRSIPCSRSSRRERAHFLNMARPLLRRCNPSSLLPVLLLLNRKEFGVIRLECSSGLYSELPTLNSELFKSGRVSASFYRWKG